MWRGLKHNRDEAIQWDAEQPDPTTRECLLADGIKRGCELMKRRRIFNREAQGK